MTLIAAALALAVSRAPEVSLPPIVWEPSAAAALAILERMDEQERRIRATEKRLSDVRGWPHDLGIVVTGLAIDMLSTGAFRDQPERNLIEGNDIIGNGPGAAEKHVAVKAIGAVIVSAICFELRARGQPRAARIVSLVVGGGFGALGVRNWVK